MRHRDSGRKLNRSSAHRKAMFRNMTASLVAHEIIRTTTPRAKALRSFAEPLITLAKKDTVANRRLAFARLRNHDAVGKLFSTLGRRYRDRPGGYMRVLKAGFRPGDRAPMAVVELLDRPGHTLTPAIERAQRFSAWQQRMEAKERAEEEKIAQSSAEPSAALPEESAPVAPEPESRARADAAPGGLEAVEQKPKRKEGGLLSRLFRRGRRDK